ncbi:hypothetical protein MMYC01_204487 [Madurella mycetomatis]|uniref:Uncharacterized protein n=1 Tax=Madurella mycetomatis TaxID=100816 RepID=A0A175W708_9PEZI|nr:hypothetical protein MMYC01_205296 [Madurella mycetomatis]KXX79558.1 hypothetical protein MMYC01_204487 [Madurella mycetomatis]
MLAKLFKRTTNPHTTAGQEGNGTSKPTNKSFYRRFQDAKRGEISEADVVKYTGKTKRQIDEWAKTRPGVAGNQAAGKLDMGPTTGLGGSVAGEGYGGWGPNANAPTKFPLTQVETRDEH